MVPGVLAGCVPERLRQAAFWAPLAAAEEFFLGNDVTYSEVLRYIYIRALKFCTDTNLS